MNFNEIITFILNFYQEHEILSLPIVFFLSFCESLAFLSLLFPATIILFGFGVLIGKSDILFLPIWLVTSLGAFFGDWVSYCFGFYFKKNISKTWPKFFNSKIINKGYIFFKHWGSWSIFFGRFFGSLRAVIPLIAGMYSMPKKYFQLFNITSALLWSFCVLAPGAFGVNWFLNLINY